MIKRCLLISVGNNIIGICVLIAVIAGTPFVDSTEPLPFKWTRFWDTLLITTPFIITGAVFVILNARLLARYNAGEPKSRRLKLSIAQFFMIAAMSALPWVFVIVSLV